MPASPRNVEEIRQPIVGIPADAFTFWAKSWVAYPLDRKEMSRILRRQIDGYVTIPIEKKSGTGREKRYRYISSPSQLIARAQRNILFKFLSNPDLFHSMAYAYIRDRSPVQCATAHLGARWLIKIDLEDFFHSIDERRVFQELRKRQVRAFHAFALARFLTRAIEKPQNWLPKKYSVDRETTFTRFFRTKILKLGFLPQGAPTSGAISNLVAFDLDNALSAIANEHGLKYSRYADDMHFSAKSEFDRTFAERVLKQALAAIRSQGFIVSGAKTRIIGPSAQMKVLGLLVNGTELRIPPGARSYIERHIWAIGKFGLQKHARTAKFRDGTALIDHLQGKLNWAHCANPAWASKQRDKLRRILESLPDRDFNGGVNRSGDDPEDWLFGRPFEWGDS